MPKSFGSFKDNFTLNKIVCDDCNQYFGKNLELHLGRDTFEGILRYNYKIKNANKYKSVGKKGQLIIKVAEGQFKGTYAYIKYSKEKDKVVLAPVSKVGFLKSSSSEYDYFMLDQVPDKDSLERAGFNLNDPESIRILGSDIETAKRILQEKGITLKVTKEMACPEGSGRLSATIEGKICDIILRARAKIGFNYLAYWEGTNFVTHSGFDPIRGYILKGEKPEYPLVGVANKAILADEPSKGLRRLGHIVTVNWAENKVSVIAQVSLFNQMTYRISLARDFSGEHRDIRRGHFFDVHNHKIIEICTK